MVQSSVLENCSYGFQLNTLENYGVRKGTHLNAPVYKGSPYEYNSLTMYAIGTRGGRCKRLCWRIVYVDSVLGRGMPKQVIFASLLMLTVSLAGCISDSAVEDVSESIELLGCMDETALNYDESATADSNLCLSMEQLIQAEEVFWGSWDSDAIDNLTDPVGYRLMIDETITWEDGENQTKQNLVVQEVFAPTYYDQEFEYKSSSTIINGDVVDSDISIRDKCPANTPFFKDWNTGPGCDEVLKCEESGGYPIWNTGRIECHSHQVRTTIFDNHVQVENFDGSEWNNYSMETASTYDEFRDNLEHGPGIRSSNSSYGVAISAETIARSENMPIDHIESIDVENDEALLAMGFPTLEQVDFEDIIFQNIETSDEGENSQLIYYLAKNNTTNTHVEIMGKMTEDGFKITEYCNNIAGNNTYTAFIEWDRRGVAPSPSGPPEIDQQKQVSGRSARIILLETVDSELRFEEYGFTEPVNNRAGNASTSCRDMMIPCRAIPFYFENIPTVAESVDENTTARSQEVRKGLNALSVKVAIAGPSGPYGMEGDLDDYYLVLSNCSIDNLTSRGYDERISQEASARSGSDSIHDTVRSNRGGVMFGSEGNSCSSEVRISLRDLISTNASSGRENGSSYGIVSGLIAFSDYDSSGTLSEGDGFEFGDNFTALCDGLDDDCDGLNMLRIYSSSAEEYSDQNIDLTDTTKAAIHDTAMNSIRTIRAINSDESQPFMESVRSIFCDGGDDDYTGCVAWSRVVW